VDQNSTFLQCLDYEGVPFHCRRCHEYNHILKDCPLPFWGNLDKPNSHQSQKHLVSHMSEGSISHIASKDRSFVAGCAIGILRQIMSMQINLLSIGLLFLSLH